MDERYLAHYGVKGMKWGVRRYQNKDGTRTKAGKVRNELRRRANMAKDTDRVNKIIASLTDDQKKFLFGEHETDLDSPWINPKQAIPVSTNLMHRTILRSPDGKDASMIELWQDYLGDNKFGDVAQVTVATSRDYQGYGYGTKVVQKGLDWFDKFGITRTPTMVWNANKKNEPSIKLAMKNGFRDPKSGELPPDYQKMVDKFKDDYVFLVYDPKLRKSKN